MSESKASYRQILKATSLFGGVQFFNILIALFRTKIIAVLIGPTGIGIASLLNSTTDLVAGFTNFGLNTSAVKAIAESDGDKEKLSRIVNVLYRLVWFTGILGFLVTLFFSYWLSKITFGDADYTILFVWVSISLLFKQLTHGRLAVLQGLRRLKDLAKANLYGSFLGLLITVPLYYYWKIEAIVPAIVISSTISFLLAFYFSGKIKIESVKLTNQEAFTEGKSMIHLGFMLSLSGFITLTSAYILQIIINRIGGIDQVGFYHAGFTILNSYVGLIFTAMSTDYFPRLASVIEKKTEIIKTVVEQAYMAILIITPIIIIFLSLAPIIVKVLYSPDFLPITAMISWGILGTLFKAVSWSMGYILIAKGDSKMFIRTAIGFNSVLLLLNVAGYFFYGFEGLGISFFVYYIFHFFALKIITKKRYEFSFDSVFFRIFILCISMCFATFIFRYIEYPILKYILMVLMFAISVVFSLYHLDKKLVFKEIFNTIIKKRK